MGSRGSEVRRFFLLLLLVAVRAFAGTITLTSDAATAPVSGFIAHHGSAAGNYPSKIDVGNVTTYAITGDVPLVGRCHRT